MCADLPKSNLVTSTLCLWLMQPTACFWEQHTVQWLISVHYILVTTLFSSWKKKKWAKALPSKHFPPMKGKIKLYSWLSQNITPVPQFYGVSMCTVTEIARGHLKWECLMSDAKVVVSQSVNTWTGCAANVMIKERGILSMQNWLNLYW